MKTETAGIEEKETTTAARSASGATSELVQEIGIDRVVADPEQPRKVFDLGGLQGLAESIKENGIVQPLIVKHPDGAKGDKFTLVAGERRLRAAKLAGLKSVPCIVRAVKNVFGVQMVENLQRENLSALEEAAALGKQIEKGRKAEELAKELGISRATVFAKVRLNSLSEAVKTELLRGNITGSVAGLIAMVPGESQGKFLKEVTSNDGFDGPMSYRRAEELLERNYARQLGKASFDTKAEYAWEKGMQPRMDTNKHESGKKAVTCEGCPRRSGNMEGSGLRNGNVCTEPRCFELKTKAAGALRAQEAKAKGLQVLQGKEAEKVFSRWNEEEVDHSSGFVELSARADVLGWDYKNHYQAALGKECPPVTVVIDKAGRARELVKREEAVAVLKANGKLKEAKREAGSHPQTAEHKRWLAMQKKEKAMGRVAGLATEKLLPKVVGLAKSIGVEDKLWPMLAKAAYRQTSIEHHAFVAKRRGLTKVQTDCREKLEQWFKENGEKPLECAEMLVDLLFCANWDAGSSYSGGPKWSPDFLAGCKLAKVDVEKLTAEMEAGQKKNDAPKKAAEGPSRSGQSRSPQPGGGSKVLPGRGESKQKGAKKKGKSRK